MLGESMSGMLTSVGVERDGGRLPEKKWNEQELVSQRVAFPKGSFVMAPLRNGKVALQSGVQRARGENGAERGQRSRQRSHCEILGCFLSVETSYSAGNGTPNPYWLEEEEPTALRD